MIKVDVFSLKNQVVGSIELPESVFGQDVNEALVLQVVKAQLAAQRQGTAKNKTKSEVRGGGRKPFKQKGTGNARQGSSRSPLNPGGGSNFGPQPRCYKQDTPKKMVQGALRSVLSDKVLGKHLVVVDDLKLATAKTKELANIANEVFGWNKALLVDVKNESAKRAASNLPKVNYLNVDGINVYDLVNHDWLVLTKAAAKAVSDRLSK